MKSKNVTHVGSQMTWEGGQGRNKQKRHVGGVTTDPGRGGRAGISKNVT